MPHGVLESGGMTASEALAQLASDYWEGILRRDPTIATFFGDFRYNDRLPDAGPEGRAAQESAFQDVLRRLEGIPEGELQRDERVSRDMPRLAAEQGLAALPFRLDEMAVDQMGGPQVWLPELLNWHPIDTPEHMDQLVARYQAFGRYMDQYLENLHDGVRDGRTATRWRPSALPRPRGRIVGVHVEDARPGAIAGRRVSGSRGDSAIDVAFYRASLGGGVYSWCMSKVRTNIEIEDTYVQRIMKRYGVRTKTAAVDLALRIVGGRPAWTREELLAMEGAHAIGEVPPDRGPRGAE